MARIRSNSGANATGITFTGLLAVAFIVLKLCGVINWSWWWVLSPIWISWAIVILLIIGFIGVEVWKEKY